jgi:PPM family protein phosphatase
LGRLSLDAWTVAGGDSIGQRSNQQDRHAVRRVDSAEIGSGWLLLVADGMGGHVAGERASEIAVDSFGDGFVNSQGAVRERLLAALHDSNARLAESATCDPALHGMGTTLLAVFISDGGLEWVSVGDSPLWLCRGCSMRRLNEDHSMRPLLEDLAPFQNRQDRQAPQQGGNLLRSALTGGAIELIDLASSPIRLRPGDTVILASDGLLTLAEGEIGKTVRAAGRLAANEIVERLLDAVGRSGRNAQDNTTVVVARAAGQPFLASLLSKHLP